tara:strand:- start:19536 stop:20243 length:708 start_codon:yes stop_codon:yes gene_type:complete
MFGFHPFAAAPFSDVGDSQQFILTDNITLGNPTVGTSSITQVHNLQSNDVTSGNVSTEQAILLEGLSLTGSNITAQNPVVDQAVFTEAENFTGDNITMAAVDVGQSQVFTEIPLTANGITANAPTNLSATMFENENFIAPNILTGTVQVESTILSHDYVLTGEINFAAPDIGTTSVIQVYTFGTNNILAGQPDIGAGFFPFTQLTPTVKVFSQETVPPEVYSEITIAAPSWTDAA